MFSIENLAWKTENIKMDEYDQYGLSAEQKGPLGGRIMWFPPYDLTFNESVRVNWNPNQFIGRGEKGRSLAHRPPADRSRDGLSESGERTTGRRYPLF